jgi:phytoene dehydrogenase-like protein
MANKVVIIGGGMAGLAAGCYLRMNGYQTEIHEMHSLPGGLCTAWQRKGYTIEGCIHWFVGSRPGDGLYQLWNELMDMESIRFVESEEFFRLEDVGGKCITVFRDIDRLQDELLAKAPEDEGVIREFTGAARRLCDFKMPLDKAPELYNIFDKGKLIAQFLPYAKLFKQWMNITGAEFAARCRNPLLRRVFETMFLPEMSALFLVFTIAWMHKKNAGYPIGGSLELARRVEKRYIELGGKIRYNSKVTRIVVEGGVAKGIELEDGEDRSADIVISAADGHCTVYELLGGRFVDEKTKDYYENYPVFPSYVQVSLGLGRTFEGLPSATGYVLEKPIVVDDMASHKSVSVRIFNFDPTMAPAGKTVVTSLLTTPNYQYWERLREDEPAKYKAQKERLAGEIIDVLERKIGGVKGCVEMVDVSTPATVIRYTNNWKGSLEGWIWGPKVGLSRMSKTLSGLENFYMIGQWVEPGGGLPTALQSGRHVAQMICRRDGEKFATKSF